MWFTVADGTKRWRKKHRRNHSQRMSMAVHALGDHLEEMEGSSDVRTSEAEAGGGLSDDASDDASDDGLETQDSVSNVSWQSQAQAQESWRKLKKLPKMLANIHTYDDKTTRHIPDSVRHP